jgi:hypothetical protein
MAPSDHCKRRRGTGVLVCADLLRFRQPRRAEQSRAHRGGTEAEPHTQPRSLSAEDSGTEAAGNKGQGRGKDNDGADGCPVRGAYKLFDAAMLPLLMQAACAPFLWT